MPEFLKLLPVGEALEVFLKNIPEQSFAVEKLKTSEAAGHVLALPVVSNESLPAFSRSSVDGYAVKARDTFGASESLPVYLSEIGEVPMGGEPEFSLDSTQTAVIHTGGMLPEGADAVVMIEYTQIPQPGEVEILKSVASQENVILKGEDVSPGMEVLPAGIRMRPAEIGGMLALGIVEADFVRKPRIGIISSGDEVISPDQTPRTGQVRDINSFTLSALVQKSGGEAVNYGIVSDKKEDLKVTLEKAHQECDVALVTAGSSASTRDLTSIVIQELGEPGVLVHGVNVRPGKPTILAVCNGKPVIGLPGNPVSALVIANLFLVPVIERLSGLKKKEAKAIVKARLKINVPSLSGREEWMPVLLEHTSQGYLAEPIFYKSNLIFALARADGLMRVSADAVGLEAGHELEVLLL